MRSPRAVSLDEARADAAFERNTRQLDLRGQFSVLRTLPPRTPDAAHVCTPTACPQSRRSNGHQDSPSIVERWARGQPPVEMTEEACARMWAQGGDKVVCYRGHYWHATSPGFYEPIHWMARLRSTEVGRPVAASWGYRASVCPDDLAIANGSLPAHVIANVSSFNGTCLSHQQGKNLRVCERGVEIRRLYEPAMLLEQGYDVYLSSCERVGSRRHLSADQYRAETLRTAGDDRWLVVAGSDSGRLLGYMRSYIVAGVLYLHDLHVLTEARKTRVATGLYVATLATCAKAGTIREACAGLNRPEQPGLGAFKEGIGFRLVNVPARYSIPAPIGAFIRFRRPATYYRLTGSLPTSEDHTIT